MKMVLHHGLITLMRLQWKAAIRRSFRGARTARGAVFLAMGIAVFLLWLGPSLVNAYFMGRSTDKVKLFFPVVFLSVCVTNLITSAGERVVGSSPVEVDFLFPGPFSRRELLLYKLARSARSGLFTATIFSVV